MKRLVAALLLGACSASAATIINVYAALAPNAFGSPSYAQWVANAVASMQSGAVPVGTPDTPAYFQTVTEVSGNQIIVTGFPSWMGETNPGTVFGPAYANELGNRLHFPIHIVSDTQFSISQLSFSLHSTDGQNALDFSFAAGSYNYGPGYVGLNWGADGVRDSGPGGDDQWITSGVNTQFVNELFGRGSGNAYWPCDPVTDCPTDADKRLAMGATAGYGGPAGEYVVTGTYSLGSETGFANVDVDPVPEPATLALVGAAFAALRVRIRRSLR